MLKAQTQKTYLMLLSLAIFIFGINIAFASEYPKHQGCINDFAGIIDQSHQYQIRSILEKIKNETSIPIVIVTVKNTALPTGDAPVLEEYATSLFDSWKIGDKNKDNGLLIIMSLDPRRIEIKTGRGLEDRVTDLESKAITQKMVPYFRKKKYGQGFLQAVKFLEAKLIENNSSSSRLDSSSSKANLNLLWVLLLPIIGLISFFSKPRRSRPYLWWGGHHYGGRRDDYFGGPGGSSGGGFFGGGSGSGSSDSGFFGGGSTGGGGAGSDY